MEFQLILLCISGLFQHTVQGLVIDEAPKTIVDSFAAFDFFVKTVYNRLEKS